MISVGLTKWFCETTEQFIRERNEYELCIRLISHAKKYIVCKFNHNSAFEVPICKEEIHSQEEEIYPKDLIVKYFLKAEEINSPSYMVTLVDMVSYEIAEDLVDFCFESSLVNFKHFDKRKTIDKTIQELKEAFTHKSTTDFRRVEETNFVVKIRQQEEERLEYLRRQQEEERRLLQEHNALMEKKRKELNKAKKKSMALLWSKLTDEEKESLTETGKIIIKHPFLGEFHIFSKRNDFPVNRYVDGKFRKAYCVVFRNWDMPIGDTVLMKIILLKTDPAEFMKVANTFSHPFR